ncbi:hypothetical protein [Streptomyces sp. ID05-47C]|uniref:hypothetical protein n=1 Tax=Streptomyces sp. ID05-47C TaxID=3028665 RepID=UPI0029A0D75A|nr:hypothetical protein [Streptomyces sp. ID05-47C]MDX3569485.1 hypothetical protein [Streptomyces sp. ID05-47C]
MTQSGQGDEPSARTAREGIVLPSDGGEPLLPGTTNGPGQDPYAGQRQYGGPQSPAPSAGPPAGGQTWGQPWGPEQQQGQSWQPPADQRQWDGDRQWDTPQPTGPDAWRAAPQAGRGQGAGPLPPEGAPAPPSYGHGVPAAPLPPMEDSATRYIPPVPAHADEGATQYIPPVPAHADEGATQYLPPVPAPAPVDEGATQYIPPVAPGALPPESPAESTHFLGRAQQNAPGARPAPGGQHGSHADAEATQYIPPVTGQSPYGAGERQPPAEFDNLFRSGGDGPAGATQQMPRFSEPEPPAYGAHPAAHAHAAHAQPAYTPPGGGSGGRRAMRDDDHGGGRSGSRVPLFAAIGVALVVVGVGAGALLSSGGGADEGDDNKTVAASAPATEESASASTDAAEQQATALDKLLADSGSSRATVISAVADVKKCGNLGKAAADLRDAAKQRTELVTKLSGLTVDQLPDHAALTTALTKAWQASASADNHYAAWADQVAADRGKLCKKGQARSTGQTQEANRASGTASAQKKQAAELWNAIAKTYGLTERQPVQL